MSILLKIYVLKGCELCDMLISHIEDSAFSSLIGLQFDFEKVIINSASEGSRLGLRIKYFPTLLAYKNNKLRLGWEGFAALAPNEIKREMVEDVLRQVAALADEDGRGDLPQEIPHQVRDDN